ncbi:MAG: response regulator transcription factor [Planctomycetota bacterium]
MKPEPVRSESGETGSILVVEDDAGIRWTLQKSLEREGFSVAVASDGEQGLERALSGKPDLCLVDVMLPRLNGFELLKALRRRGSIVPVIFLTAKGAEMDRVLGLDLGADDYIPKPFSLRELLARIQAVLRRTRARAIASGRLRFADCLLDREARRLQRAGSEVPMTQREFDLLRFLLEHPKRVLSRREILGKVWGYDYYGTDRTVDNFVNQLREKIGDDAEHPRWIATVRGAGYRFDAEVRPG